MTQTTAPHARHQVPTRRISFEEALQEVPRHFAADGDLLHSHFAASLSAVFPDGEDFFVRSVRHYRSDVTDPELKELVKGFIGQEALHGREHRAFNARLAELGYPTQHVERITARLLAFRERVASPKANLAATAALEHFTATLAETLLSEDETQSLFGHPEVLNLFLWHALEELEHKSVAFDVYRHVDGSERMRIWTMRSLMVGFMVGMTIQMVASLLGDRATYRPGTLRQSWRRFKRSPLLRRSVWRRLRDYNRPGFHPTDHDTTELEETWRQRLFGQSGTLNDKLAGAAA